MRVVPLLLHLWVLVGRCISLDAIDSLLFVPSRQATTTMRTTTRTVVGPYYSPRRMISSGFTFDDGDQILVSAQKPLGMVLEQDPDTGIILVTQVDPEGSAGKGGVQVRDVLVAVQNASVEGVDLDDVLTFIGNGPRVMNLRLVRAS